MDNILSGLLDQVLGPSERASRGNRKYTCPNADCASRAKGKRKLEIDTITDENGCNKYNCWVCGYKGNTIKSLFRKIGAAQSWFDSLSMIIVRDPTKNDVKEIFNGFLPKEYLFLGDAKPSDIIARHARFYLKTRGVTEEDIYKYQIGFCEDGPYAERIIIPSLDKSGKPNFFIGRGFYEEVYPKYKLPEVSRDIIPFELYINWNQPIILCEGGLDAIAIKRNAIPLLGLSITDELMKKLLSPEVRKIYVALDNDALKTALRHCESFLSSGKKVYLVEMHEKDPSKMGFEEFTKHIQNATPLTLRMIMKLKLSLI